MDGRSKRKIELEIRYCQICNKEIPRNTKQGEKRISPKQYINTLFCSRKCKGVYHSTIISKENNPRWKGGISTENEIERGSIEYKKWRLAVFARDKWTCQCCGYKGGNIVAHHLDGFSNNKKLRYITNNGITLCEGCHSDFHKQYGAGNNTLEQFLSFIK